MTEIERFERRLATALERYADEVPTSVDAVGLARSIAAEEAGRGWRSILASWHRLTPAVRYALVLAILAALLVALGILSQRVLLVDDGAVSTGRMDCAGPSWTTSTVTTVRLACQGELPGLDTRDGLRIVLDQETDSAGFPVWSGRLDGSGSRGAWSGDIVVFVSWDGLVTGEAVLDGPDPDTQAELRLHLISDGGLAWGVLARRGSADAP